MTDPSLQTRISSFMKERFDPAPADAIAVAVSGGSDSLALALLLKDWGRQHSVDVIILSVDHGLRASSAEECQQVKAWMADHGLDTVCLKWHGPYPQSAVQQAARDARYRLMSAYCQQNNIRHLFLGHQLEDQAETALMRFAKGSGVDGLSAMLPVTRLYGLELVRPLLQVRRAQLRTFLDQQGQDWIEDPSNENPRFARTRVGKILELMAENGDGSLEGILLTTGRMAKTRAFLDKLTHNFLGDAAVFHDYGFVHLNKRAFSDADDVIAERALSYLLQYVAGRQYAVKSSGLDRLARQMRDGGLKTASLGGCLVAIKKDHWLVCREEGRGLPELRISGQQSFFWDNRFRITDRQAGRKFEDTDLSIRRIGRDGWQQIRDSTAESRDNRLPAIVRNSLPAVWKGPILASAPLISYNCGLTGIAEDRFEMVFKPAIDN